jgi:sporulation protein YlmC with PRC-barrel domain
VILHETASLFSAQTPEPAADGPSVRLPARPRLLRLRCELPPSSSERVWLLELEVEVPAIDPEQLLAACEDFLVDGEDGRRLGVVEQVEKSLATGEATALVVSAGWFGRRRLRVDVSAVQALVPAERRVIVDEARVTPVLADDRRA